MQSGILTLSGVSVGRRLCDVSLALDPTRPTVLIGPNGAGKSTLLRAVAGLERVTAGTIDVAGSWSRDPTQRAALIAWLAQHPRIEEGLTALDVAVAGRFRFREPRPVAEAAARRALAEHHAEHWSDRPMTTLSGGEAQRVRLAAMQAQEASWWLLDEPFNHLDPGVRFGLLAGVAARAEAGGGVVLVTHDLSWVPWMPTARVIAMREGRVVYDGTVGDDDLPDAVGPLLGVRIAALHHEDQLQYVVMGTP